MNVSLYNYISNHFTCGSFAAPALPGSQGPSAAPPGTGAGPPTGTGAGKGDPGGGAPVGVGAAAGGGGGGGGDGDDPPGKGDTGGPDGVGGKGDPPALPPLPPSSRTSGSKGEGGDDRSVVSAPAAEAAAVAVAESEKGKGKMALANKGEDDKMDTRMEARIPEGSEAELTEIDELLLNNFDSELTESLKKGTLFIVKPKPAPPPLL